MDDLKSMKMTEILDRLDDLGIKHRVFPEAYSDQDRCEYDDLMNELTRRGDEGF